MCTLSYPKRIKTCIYKGKAYAKGYHKIKKKIRPYYFVCIKLGIYMSISGIALSNSGINRCINLGTLSYNNKYNRK